MGDQLSADLASLRIQREEDPDAKSTRRNRLLVAGVIVIALAALVPLWRSLSARVFKTDVEVTEIRMISPAQASIQVTSTGFVAARTRSKVGAKLLGRVAEVLVAEGDQVVAGQVLVRLDEAEAKMAITASRARAAAARARVQSADAGLTEARRQFERERTLSEQGAALRSTVEDLESRVQTLQESVRAASADAAAASAELQQHQLNLEYLTVTAPIDGVVVSRPVDVGELVGPTADAVLELADFSTLVVETDVPEARLGLIERGGPAEIVLDAYPTVRRRGQVLEISPKVNRVKATVVVRVTFVDPVEGVLPDMSARVSFLDGALDKEAVKEPPKLFVPESAVVEQGGEKVVYRIDGGQARLERVTLGEPMAGGFQLLHGPGDGTRVIANPPAQIADGHPVRERGSDE